MQSVGFNFTIICVFFYFFFLIFLFLFFIFFPHLLFCYGLVQRKLLWAAESTTIIATIAAIAQSFALLYAVVVVIRRNTTKLVCARCWVIRARVVGGQQADGSRPNFHI
ncbi:hypothetical protein DER46DRAFT_611506 [Fusarium sp. MPI-SDFR-AT-0072]|nr:hypothetical protein DER46DRAFT_611506 [Fusarium sp. MPI-SDFR-AT-0072]